MITGRRASDWLRDTAEAQSQDGNGECRGGDRRALDRRAPRRRIDPLFAATLLNQIAPGGCDYVHGYGAKASEGRSGAILNRWA